MVNSITEQEKEAGNSIIAEISKKTGLVEISDEDYEAALTLLSMTHGVSEHETAEAMLELINSGGGGRAQRGSRAQRGGANSKVVHFISILCIAAAAGIGFKIAFYIAGKFGLFAMAERAMVIAESQIASCGSLAEGLGQYETHKYMKQLVGDNIDHIIPPCSLAWKSLETSREALGATTSQFIERLTTAGVVITFASYNKVYSAIDSLLSLCFIEKAQVATEEEEKKQGGGRKRTKSRRKQGSRKRAKSRRKQGGVKKTNKRKTNKGGRPYQIADQTDPCQPECMASANLPACCIPGGPELRCTRSCVRRGCCTLEGDAVPTGGWKKKSKNKTKLRSRRKGKRTKTRKKRRGGTTPVIRRDELKARNRRDTRTLMHNDARDQLFRPDNDAEQARRTRRLKNAKDLSRLLNKKQYREDMGDDEERNLRAVPFPGRVAANIRTQNWGRSHETERARQNYAEEKREREEDRERRRN